MVLMIYDRIRSPLAVPVREFRVQLFTKKLHCLEEFTNLWNWTLIDVA